MLWVAVGIGAGAFSVIVVSVFMALRNVRNGGEVLQGAHAALP
jgi:hypothetical protein